MSIKILVADDSTTIQKVIAITLANSSYELTEALTEDELFKKISIDSFDLILLDFSLSQKSNPYELIEQVCRKSPASKIISLIGTFDAAEDSLIKKSGAADKLTKPFESSKFVKKISSVLEEVGGHEDFQIKPSFSERIQTEQNQDWVLNAPKVSDLTNAEFTQEEVKGENYILNNELDSWGMIPPVITKVVSNIQKNIVQDDIWKIDAPNPPQALPVNDSEYTLEKPFRSKLVPISELKELEIEHYSGHDQTAPIQINLESELAEDLQTKEEFWATEERAIINDPLVKEMAAGFNQINSPKIIESNYERFDEQKIVEKVVEKITPILEKMIKEYCIKSVDKVAWEVIPDLAENLITREIKELSRKAQQG
jgi:DNA-binding response OmpR family regulator